MARKGKTPTPNIKRQERRKQSVQKRQERNYNEKKNINKRAAGEYRQMVLEKAKARYEESHKYLTTIKERFNNGEINQAIRYLYDKGFIKGKFQYYEDFVEQHQNEFTKEEVAELLEKHEEEERIAFENTIDILTDGDTYIPTKKRKSKGGIVFFS